MAKQEFIQNLRLARNLFVHRVEADRPGTDADAVARRLSRSLLWLTPAAVQGFDAADFLELSESVRDELERSAREFREVAAQVPSDGPATSEQEAAAKRTFAVVIEIMEPYFATAEEVRLLRVAMKQVHFPEVVQTWDYEFGRDSSGDPAVWIWVVVDDAVADDKSFTAVSTRLRREIRQGLQGAGSKRWPYVGFRTFSEQKSLQAVAS